MQGKKGLLEVQEILPNVLTGQNSKEVILVELFKDTTNGGTLLSLKSQRIDLDLAEILEEELKNLWPVSDRVTFGLDDYAPFQPIRNHGYSFV